MTAAALVVLSPEQLEALKKSLRFDRDRVGAPGSKIRLQAAWLLQVLEERERWRSEHAHMTVRAGKAEARVCGLEEKLAQCQLERNAAEGRVLRWEAAARDVLRAMNPPAPGSPLARAMARFRNMFVIDDDSVSEE